MEQSTIISVAMKIYHASNLNTYVLDRKADFIYHHERISIPAFMPGSNDEDILYLYKQMSTQIRKLYSYTNDWGLHYFGYAFSIDEEAFTVIIGPYFDSTPNLYGLSREYNLNSNQSEDLRIICNQIQVITLDKARSFSSILEQFEMMLGEETTPTFIVSDKQSKRINKKDSFTVDEDAEIIKMRYKIERDFMHAVETGEKDAAMKLLNSNNMLFSFSERFPNQPLLRVKNLAIVLNTLLRVAALNRDVPPILIHRISEKYAFEIEYTSQLAKLHQLYDEMIEEYFDLIISNSLKGYTKVTQRVIGHLVSFYDKQIDNNELAELTFTHPSHLSRKFKQETGKTITAYQQMIRMDKARHLLKTEDISIEEVAWMVGYEDASYFTRVFKKETGYTPSQYREMRIKNE